MSDLMVPIVMQLEQDPNALRIKKLLLYTCKNWWESDSTRLSVISLQSLIEEIRIAHPTIEQLRSRLTHLIGTLNKSSDYAAVGQIIIAVLQRLYAQEAVTIITPPESRLEQDVNLSRIKKLLIYTCRHYWEANSHVIEQISLQELLSELFQLYPTLEALRSGFSATIKTLNKPVEYALIAELIVRDMESQYGQEATPAIAEPVESINLFDVRLEILKSANPLQVKILLFSSAYYVFEFSQQDWINLKLYSLEGLLKTVLSQTSSIEAFQQTLTAKAEQLKNSEQYLELVPVILRSLRSSYTKLQRQLQHALQSGSVADRTLAGSTQAG